ncbi:hypothetical protein B0H34DRAFT_801546 [Crassisporium funariophilum]|nr:hypothetical protein B0H34DRAFT_801546 [Crassisporium funariophilum]
MAPTAPVKGSSKKEKKTKQIPASVDHVQTAAPVLAEPSSKSSKSLKRKKESDTTHEAAPTQTDAEPSKASKKAKKDDSRSSKLPKSKVAKAAPAEKDVLPVDVADVATEVMVETKKKSSKEQKSKPMVVDAQPTPKAVEPTPEKSKTSKSKSKTSAVVPPAVPEPVISPAKENNKKSKQVKAPSAPVPASISRPETIKSSKSAAKKTKAVIPEPEPLSVAEPEEDEMEVTIEQDSNEGSDDDDVHLHGFSTDDDDSSDEEDAMDDEPSEFDVSKLPTIAKDDVTVKRKLEKAKRTPTEDRGVLFLGRLPHGFYEDQLKAYFSQFGNVTRLRVSRNQKTGKSKHYGFIEFDSSSVAQIVADTMDNYLLMGHILRCKVIPKDEVHPELWVGANRKWRVVPRDRVVRVEHNKPRTETEQLRAAKRLLKRQNERKRKLAQAGIKYDFDGVGYKKTKEVAS